MAFAALVVWLSLGARLSWSHLSSRAPLAQTSDRELANLTDQMEHVFQPWRSLRSERDQYRYASGSPSVPWWFWAPPPILGVLQLPCMSMVIRLSCAFGVGLAISSLCAIVCTLFGQLQLPSVIAKISGVFTGCLLGVVLAHGDFILVGILQTPILGDSIEYVCLAIAVSPVFPQFHRAVADQNGVGLAQARLKLLCMSIMGVATLLMINTLKVGRDWTLRPWEVPASW
mmetsp:Transcript_40414/g.116744  ORF Transcript_40414/g.116744 Transcript_40414/m.116744 type:complete len:229 (-) Transcript_40414:219-905(-)